MRSDLPDVKPSERDRTLLAAVQHPLTPPSLLLLTGGPPERLKQAPAAFDPAGLATTQHEATSADGERIPCIQVGPPGLTGEAPVHMTAYGGFRVSGLPVYKDDGKDSCVFLTQRRPAGLLG